MAEPSIDYDAVARLTAAVVGAVDAVTVTRFDAAALTRLGATGVTWSLAEEEPFLRALVRPDASAVAVVELGTVPAAARLIENGLHTAVVVPLIEGGVVVAVIAAYTSTAIALPPAARQRLLDVVRTVAPLLDATRLAASRDEVDRERRIAGALADLLRSGSMSGNATAVIRATLRNAAETLLVDRAAMYRLAPDSQVMEGVDLFDRGMAHWTIGGNVRAAEAPALFRALAEGEVIPASDVRSDPRTSELTARWDAMGVASALFAPICESGRLIGALALTHRAPRRWTRSETRFAAAAAGWLAVAGRAEAAVSDAPSTSVDRRLAAFVEGAPDRVVLADLTGRIAYANLAVTRALGFSPGELIGHSLAEFLPNEFKGLPGTTAVALTGHDAMLDQVVVREVVTRTGDSRIWETQASVVEHDGKRWMGIVARDLSAANQRLEATLAGVSLGVAHVSLTGRFLRANEAFRKLVGRTERELETGYLGRYVEVPDANKPDLLQVLGLPQDRFDLTTVRAHLVSALAPYELEHELLRPDGTAVHIELSIALTRDAAMRPAMFVVIARNVTAPRRAAAVRRELTTALTGTGPELLPELASFLGRALAARCVLIGRVIDGARVAPLAAWLDGAPFDAPIYELVGTPCESVLRAGVCYYPERIQALFPADDMLRELEVESYFGAPLRDREGRAVGLIAVLGRTAIDPALGPEDLLRICATRVEAELERRAATDVLADREEQLRQVTESAREVFWLTGWPDLHAIYVSRGSEEQSGRGPGIGQSWRDVLHPDDRDATTARLAQVEAGPVDFKARIVRVDGVIRWIRLRASIVRDAAGVPYRVAGTSEDVTEMEDARRALEESERRLAIALRATETEVEVLQERLGEHDRLEGMVGAAPTMRKVYRRLRQAAQSDVSVMITGESGTGKELAAQALHALSARSSRPFVAVNCAAIPEPLLESELFGHIKGAFTGAGRDKVGLMQAAEGGTLFLDEIGDMSLVLQVKLLRALQERQIRRVGDERSVPVDFRLISATHRDLRTQVAAGRMREDFYYRIRVFEVEMPALRDRRDDIPMLAAHFTNELGRAAGKPGLALSSAAMRALVAHRWPGNVRELRNAIEHALVTVTGTSVQVDDLPVEVRHAMAAEPAVSAPAGPREQIEDALKRSGGNRAEAARLLGISRVTLWKRMRRLGLTGEDDGDDSVADEA